jgi:hypothetical protein
MSGVMLLRAPERLSVLACRYECVQKEKMSNAKNANCGFD